MTQDPEMITTFNTGKDPSSRQLFTVRLRPELIDAIRERAEQEQRTITVVAELALSHWLKTTKPQLPGIAD